MSEPFKNPFRPGAGQKPPHLAGRVEEREKFRSLLDQETVFRNMLLTGLRGTGKTVLSETFIPLAYEAGWLWVGTDMSESASVSEETLATRLLTDLAVITSIIPITEKPKSVGFAQESEIIYMDYNALVQRYMAEPGLVGDKLKATLSWAWEYMKLDESVKGIVFAYDEAQNMSDKSKDGQFPLSMLLDIFQHLQRRDIPFMILLVGLPTLFPKLVDARTYSERMFEVVELKSLTPEESRDAIVRPITQENCPVPFATAMVDAIVKQSGGYPFFIQFICREVYDFYLGQLSRGVDNKVIPLESIIAKLDTVFFAGRWNNITDRQRELMGVIARIPNHDSEFTIQEVKAETDKSFEKPISSSLINQMFARLEEAGLMHKTRHGKYSLGIPLLADFIQRQQPILP